MTSIKDIKKFLEEGKIVIGAKTTLKAMKKGEIKEILLSKNCPEEYEKDFKSYGKISNIKVTKLSYPNDELGAICKKPFSVSVIGIKNE